MMAAEGDWLVVESSHLGTPKRRGRILAARGLDGSPPFLVRWSDSGHETLVFPGSDAHVESHEHGTDRRRVGRR